MSESDLSQRLAALEQRLEEEARLRVSQDRDLADYNAGNRAQHHVLQSLAITQAGHNMNLSDLRRSFGHLERRAAIIDAKIDGLTAGVQQVLELLGRRDGEKSS